MIREKSCGAVIFFENQGSAEILLIKHVNGGHWSFPKGHVENDETEQQTALREIGEETGLSVSLNTNFRKVVTYSPKADVVKDVIYFIAVAQSKCIKTQKEEVSDYIWADLDTAVNMASYENDKKIMAEAIDFYKAAYEK